MKKYFCLLFLAILGVVSLYATPTLIGTWVATIEHNRSFDTYRINFTADGRCTVKVSNDTAEQETSGNWPWDGTMKQLFTSMN